MEENFWPFVLNLKLDYRRGYFLALFNILNIGPLKTPKNFDNRRPDACTAACRDQTTQKPTALGSFLRI